MEAIKPFMQPGDVVYQESGPAKRKGFPERDRWIASLRHDKHMAGVANAFNLGISSDDVNNVIAAIESKGAIFFEAITQRHSDNLKELREMYREACEVFDGKGISTAVARDLGMRRAAKWDRAQLKPGRMPFAEAQVYLNDLNISLLEAIRRINKVSRERIGPEKRKRYPTPWTKDFAYQMREKNMISFPNRAAGRPRKPRT